MFKAAHERGGGDVTPCPGVHPNHGYGMQPPPPHTHIHAQRETHAYAYTHACTHALAAHTHTDTRARGNHFNVLGVADGVWGCTGTGAHSIGAIAVGSPCCNTAF